MHSCMNSRFSPLASRTFYLVAGDFVILFWRKDKKYDELWMKVYVNLYSQFAILIKWLKWPYFEEWSAILSFLEGENSNEIEEIPTTNGNVQSVGKRALITKSVVWDYFKKLSKEDDKAQCTICSESLKHSQNTSNLFKVCKQYKIHNYNKKYIGL